ncbi:MAG: hypothetical protein V4735_08245 [Pseudomonadota bacterium]
MAPRIQLALRLASAWHQARENKMLARANKMKNARDDDHRGRLIF